MIIRPQQKQQKQRQAMITALKNGDRIITSGGLYATVKDVHEDFVVAFISDGVKVEIAKSAIGGVVTKKD
jgi:preprotein translocase subunit YajC